MIVVIYRNVRNKEGKGNEEKEEERRLEGGGSKIGEPEECVYSIPSLPFRSLLSLVRASSLCSRLNNWGVGSASTLATMKIMLKTGEFGSEQTFGAGQAYTN
jgi:hypothetical protein